MYSQQCSFIVAIYLILCIVEMSRSLGLLSRGDYTVDSFLRVPCEHLKEFYQFRLRIISHYNAVYPSFGKDPPKCREMMVEQNWYSVDFQHKHWCHVKEIHLPDGGH